MQVQLKLRLVRDRVEATKVPVGCLVGTDANGVHEVVAVEMRDSGTVEIVCRGFGSIMLPVGHKTPIAFVVQDEGE